MGGKSCTRRDEGTLGICYSVSVCYVRRSHHLALGRSSARNCSPGKVACSVASQLAEPRSNNRSVSISAVFVQELEGCAESAFGVECALGSNPECGRIRTTTIGVYSVKKSFYIHNHNDYYTAPTIYFLE